MLKVHVGYLGHLEKKGGLKGRGKFDEEGMRGPIMVRADILSEDEDKARNFDLVRRFLLFSRKRGATRMYSIAW